MDMLTIAANSLLVLFGFGQLLISKKCISHFLDFCVRKNDNLKIFKLLKFALISWSISINKITNFLNNYFFWDTIKKLTWAFMFARELLKIL